MAPLLEIAVQSVAHALVRRIEPMADAQPALLLMDERAGRAVAVANGLKVAGTASVIGMAKQRGLIALAKPVFERLHRSDFRISAEVIAVVLRRVGE